MCKNLGVRIQEAVVVDDGESLELFHEVVGGDVAHILKRVQIFACVDLGKTLKVLTELSDSLKQESNIDCNL